MGRIIRKTSGAEPTIGHSAKKRQQVAMGQKWVDSQGRMGEIVKVERDQMLPCCSGARDIISIQHQDEKIPVLRLPEKTFLAAYTYVPNK